MCRLAAGGVTAYGPAQLVRALRAGVEILGRNWATTCARVEYARARRCLAGRSLKIRSRKRRRAATLQGGATGSAPRINHAERKITKKRTNAGTKAARIQPNSVPPRASANAGFPGLRPAAGRTESPNTVRANVFFRAPSAAWTIGHQNAIASFCLPTLRRPCSHIASPSTGPHTSRSWRRSPPYGGSATAVALPAKSAYVKSEVTVKTATKCARGDASPKWALSHWPFV